MTERFADNDGVAIRFLESDTYDPAITPVILVPGITDFADDYTQAIEYFAERRLLVVEMRGRGRSDAPPSGYRPEDQASDVIAVLNTAGVGRFHLMTFSRGTTPGLVMAFRDPKRVLTVSIGDYLPQEIRLQGDFVDNMLALTWRGRPNSERVSRHVFESIAADSQSRDFCADLAGLSLPVLVARGSKGGVVNDAAEARYRAEVPGVEIVTIAGSDHDLFRPSRTAYPAAVLEFIARRTSGPEL